MEERATVSCVVTTVDGVVGYAELTAAQANGYCPDDVVAVCEDAGGEVRCHDVRLGDAASVVAESP